MKTLEFKNHKLKFIEQTKLPLIEEYIETDNYDRIAEAIEKLEIRGAPAIGVAAAYALALAVKVEGKNIFDNAYERIFKTRPTAVNLFWALQEMRKVFEANVLKENIAEILINKAIEIHKDDENKCEKMARNGLNVFNKKVNVLTHCNAGALATGGEGTAVNVIKKGFDKGFVEFVYADETRPLLQGSRLTAFELEKHGIPFKIICDNMAAFLMQQGKVDMVIVGADRIASNGDAANKIGTYGLAVLCNYHKIPFYIAAPTSTIDIDIKSGKEIKIEERKSEEITSIKDLQITKKEYNVYNPAFDVTPNELITGIITENGFYTKPYDFQ